MLDSATGPLTEQIFETARRAPPAQALQSACLLVTGRDGFLAGRSHAIHLPDTPLVDPAEPAADVGTRSTRTEHGIACFGLVLSEVAPRPLHPRPASVALATLALRAGILAHAMDMAFAHLETRESLGQKTLHHQLVKARFSASSMFVNQLRRELILSDPRGDIEGCDRLHTEIDTHMVQVAKLMGGHGLREGAVHGLEYLSTLIRATLVPSSHSGV
ncbi:hypothetical protein [Epibacterium sp. Ofav1-8]|uniref:hypothetical protein n=1 Tax=Epibacterium sp. Ofav1-8 TaxID=2917735 RepID=UPI001EF67D07|nr:hypothetical protein [Epibacterium sp. Ofav1-8]MCG7622250.1 hypothetical protein [Epibacterium sp. Ofav1-8]